MNRIQLVLHLSLYPQSHQIHVLVFVMEEGAHEGHSAYGSHTEAQTLALPEPPEAGGRGGREAGSHTSWCSRNFTRFVSPSELRGFLDESRLEQPTVSEETTLTFLLKSGSPELTEAWLGRNPPFLSWGDLAQEETPPNFLNRPCLRGEEGCPNPGCLWAA